MKARKEILELVAEAQAGGARKEVACKTAGASLRTVQRWENDSDDDGRKNNKFPVNNALTVKERQKVVDVACSPEFRDRSPNQIVPILAEKGLYFASESTFYRLLKKAGLLTHRSKAKAPERQRPEEITASGPNQVWTWDISYFLTLVRGSYLYLYLILDIWDRSIVGWAVHETESGLLAGDLLRETCMSQKVRPGSLTVHQDNGAPMISSEFLGALAFWGQPSYSRPGVSDDNPFSESQFRTLKYRPDFPGRFESIEDAIAWLESYAEWYNTEHRHSKIGFVAPSERRGGADIAILETRRETYENARIIHPERWSRGIRKWDRPETVTLNPRDKNKGRQEVAA